MRVQDVIRRPLITEKSSVQREGINVLALEVDPNLTGGVVIRSGDTVIDASIRGRLSQLAQTLA